MFYMKLFGKEKIQKLGIFNGIEDTMVEEILANAARETFHSWETIIHQWDVSNSTGYIIESWSVQVIIDGEEKAQLSQGDIFWEIALLNEEARSASVVATDDTTVIVISQSMLFEMINNDDNSINKEIMRRMEENLENE